MKNILIKCNDETVAVIASVGDNQDTFNRFRIALGEHFCGDNFKFTDSIADITTKIATLENWESKEIEFSYDDESDSERSITVSIETVYIY